MLLIYVFSSEIISLVIPSRAGVSGSSSSLPVLSTNTTEPFTAVLPTKVLLVIVTVVSKVPNIAPPYVAELFTNKELVTEMSLIMSPNTAAPKVATLLVNTQLSTII